MTVNFPYGIINHFLKLQTHHTSFRGIAVLAVPVHQTTWFCLSYGKPMFSFTHLSSAYFYQDVLCVYVCVLSRFPLFVATIKVDRQTLLSMAFPRQEYWSELSFSTPEDLSDPGIESLSLESSALEGDSLPLAPPGKPRIFV